MRTFALIPAAGKSVRMGQPKLALPLGDYTVLEHVVAALHEGGISDILVVLGPHVAFLKEMAENAGAKALVLPEETPDMRTTVQYGLDWIERHRQPATDDAWLLVPADHPTLAAAVVRALLEARRVNPQATIVLPTHEGKRGHPALIAWKHAEGMRGLPADQGLNVYLRQHQDETLELPWPTADVLTDLDTPADYEKLRRKV